MLNTLVERPILLVVAGGTVVGCNDACSFNLATLHHHGDVLLDRLGAALFRSRLSLHVLFELELLLRETVSIFP